MTQKKQVNPDDSLLARYQQMVQAGTIKDDAAQREVLASLEALAAGLGRKRGRFRKSAPVRGLYIWGNVGRGKSMLMDLFYENAPVAKKSRIHFHSFMQVVHARIHQLRKDGRGDPVMMLAKELAAETALLCFDELQATDVADASLLHRLFSGLFDAGVVIVSTSNHPPASLYTGGHQRERFNAFIALIEQHMQVAALSSPSDYRHMQIKSLRQVYFSPLGPMADGFIADVLEHVCGDARPTPDSISVQGRVTEFTSYSSPPPAGGRPGGGHNETASLNNAPLLTSPLRGEELAVGRFTFTQLCEAALGPADYLAIAKRLDTVILTGIPKLSPEKRNEAKRFVTLIDALYENKVKLIATAEAPPAELYSDGDGSFEFKRTVSRLAEMQSEKYLQE